MTRRKNRHKDKEMRDTHIDKGERMRKLYVALIHKTFLNGTKGER